MQPQAPDPTPGQPNYDFILNPSKPTRKPLLPALSGGTSKLKRILLSLGVLVLLLVLFSIVKSLLSSVPANQAALITVAADQQEMVHIIASASQALANSQESLSSSNQNLIVTAQLGLASEQKTLATYMAQNHIKASVKQLSSRSSASIDAELTASIAASTYNQTFTSVMQSQLTLYQQDLAKAYKLTTGPKGKALLYADGEADVLLVRQLNTPSD